MTAKANKAMMAKAKAIMHAIATEMQDKSDGVSLQALRDTKTGRLLSIHITPVDMVLGIPTPRYQAAEQQQQAH